MNELSLPAIGPSLTSISAIAPAAGQPEGSIVHQIERKTLPAALSADGMCVSFSRFRLPDSAHEIDMLRLDFSQLSGFRHSQYLLFPTSMTFWNDLVDRCNPPRGIDERRAVVGSLIGYLRQHAPRDSIFHADRGDGAEDRMALTA
ncbi:hypothetical protein [Acidiphilium acidophilum]|uniref:hypothetical protein n=1 Tax=Acidiphilium acidophilum TaxID=76588 RepID=UPI002E8E7989|nr:hypothetical protein [Acidiphilium acidophilum]